MMKSIIYLRKFLPRLFLLLVAIGPPSTLLAQEKDPQVDQKSSSTPTIISLAHQPIPDLDYSHSETRYRSAMWDTEVITNVSVPELWIYQPTPETLNGTAVIIAPGGGLFAHSINSEGVQVAEWLVQKGITALVLKYRLAPTRGDGVAEMSLLGQTNPQEFIRRIGQVLPFSIQDGLEAVKYVRQEAENLQIDPKKIGFMGFSAGGAVTMGVAYGSTEESMPDFLVPVYTWTAAIPVQKAPEMAPPMLVICATDDELGLAGGSIELYNSWYNEGYRVGLHMYSQGGHGFGMRTKNLPSDNWIERFYEWAIAEKLIKQ